ncbi:bifunctional protein-serine/threonine kinase/phosphatase [Marinobacterium sp. D7]|uniref:bifunctional protein-serine/threonine kinase/phosphatase n=1 Tax=Marinobacterium ramblicola TaxID=2849041 RepID=UPI001C2D7D64|nr:bifunctional protein-serine/threonine kinase/phosphatase [Marinobacterium ramblicola]MBV1789512.1 bifunctional protein-serine/threonine kinase/phosphatase [Marinobacterium ramblicola]
MSKRLQVRFGGCSEAGRKSVNQDAFAAHLATGNGAEFKGAAAAIADGVSSCADSHIASQTAVTSFLEDYFSTPQSWSVRKSVSRVLTSLNGWIYQQNANRQSHLQNYGDSMLTTFSSVVIKSHTLHCFHAGDSRVYHWRDGTLEQLTQDHLSIAAGQGYLARALGADRHLEVDYSTQDLAVGDLLMLSTDGVHGVLSAARLRELLTDATTDLEAAARRIVAEALEAGSDDNLTVLLVAIDGLPQETLDETHRRLTALPIPPVMSVGNRIDGYEVLEVIFSGTRSHMYRVRDEESGEQFTLKAPSQNFSEDALYLDGFVREEWVGRCIDHPNVMKTYEPRREKRFLYYLGEYIEGINLREWMHDHPRPPVDEVRRIVQQAVQGLRAFQRADMVHQDLKPENIMLDREGRVKILDFGTVLIAGTDELISPLDKSIPQGSVNYVAPEYLVGEPGSFRSDLFSLAVIAYEMLTGALPYKEPSVKQVQLKNYAVLDYIPALQHRRDLPLWIEGCLRKALQPNPRYRYEALSEFLHDFTVPNTQLEARIRHRPLVERNPLLLWKLICLGLLLLNLYQWVVNR